MILALKILLPLGIAVALIWSFNHRAHGPRSLNPRQTVLIESLKTAGQTDKDLQ